MLVVNAITLSWSQSDHINQFSLNNNVGLILTQTQMALSDLSSPFFQITDLKTIALFCNILIPSRKILLKNHVVQQNNLFGCSVTKMHKLFAAEGAAHFWWDKDFYYID